MFSSQYLTRRPSSSKNLIGAGKLFCLSAAFIRFCHLANFHPEIKGLCQSPLPAFGGFVLPDPVGLLFNSFDISLGEQPPPSPIPLRGILYDATIQPA
jgi:hypothetical protein